MLFRSKVCPITTVICHKASLPYKDVSYKQTCHIIHICHEASLSYDNLPYIFVHVMKQACPVKVCPVDCHALSSSSSMLSTSIGPKPCRPSASSCIMVCTFVRSSPNVGYSLFIRNRACPIYPLWPIVGTGLGEGWGQGWAKLRLRCTLISLCDSS